MKHHFKSVILVFLFSLSSIVLAEESCVNENKNNRTGNDVSNADSIDNPGCNPALCVTENTVAAPYIERDRMLEQRRQDAAEKKAASQLRTHKFPVVTDEVSTAYNM